VVRHVALAIRSRITDKTGNNPQRESQAGRGVLGSLRNQAITPTKDLLFKVLSVRKRALLQFCVNNQDFTGVNPE
jgi:hypothetical protein